MKIRRYEVTVLRKAFQCIASLSCTSSECGRLVTIIFLTTTSFWCVYDSIKMMTTTCLERERMGHIILTSSFSLMRRAQSIRNSCFVITHLSSMVLFFLVNFWLLQLLCAKEEQDFVSELILKISDILPGSNIVNLEEENHGNSKLMKIKHSLVLDLC